LPTSHQPLHSITITPFTITIDQPSIAAEQLTNQSFFFLFSLLKKYDEIIVSSRPSLRR
jgi:hypothetical protein